MTPEEKIELIKTFREERNQYNAAAYEIVLQCLTLDVLDGGSRFENLYSQAMI